MNTKVSLGVAAVLSSFAIVATLWSNATPVHAATASGTIAVTVAVNGGPANPSDFTVQVKQNGSNNSGTLSASGSAITFVLAAGSYTLSETAIPSGYTATWSGACNAQGAVIVTPGTTATCTVTNTFGPVGSIKVTTVVKGGTATPADFTVHLKKNGAADTGSPSGSGSTITFNQLTPGQYTVIQSTPPTGYSAVWSGACNAQGNVTVVGNAIAACTVTNTFTPTSGGGSGSTGTRNDRPVTPPRPTR